jgi:hypothetical protein
MPDEQSLVDSLFTVIENVMFYGDRLQGGQFVSMMSPGQFVSLNLKEGNKNDEFIQYDVTNDCLDTSFIRKPLTSTIGGQYDQIFSFMAVPYKQLTPAQQQELSADIATVDQLQDTYNQYQDAFNKADGDYQAALTNPDVDSTLLQQLADARQRAQQEWDTAGKRQQFETAYSDSLYLQSGDPRAFFQKLNQQRTNFFLNSARGSYYRTLFEPAVADWSSASWTHAVLDTKTTSSSSYSRSTQWSGGLSVGWGLWSFGGSGGHSETYQHSHTEATEMTADLEYLRVRISRPWLDKDVFSFRFWTWLKTHGFVYLSDGGNISANPPVRPIGIMPFYPEEMIVVRNVKLTANFTATDNQIITSHMQAGASFGYGPFSISGSYSEDTSEVDTSATFDGATITITQPQIMAFLGDLMPQCPNPDPTLPWQGDEVFPSSMTLEQSSKLRGIRYADRIMSRLRRVSSK